MLFINIRRIDMMKANHIVHNKLLIIILLMAWVSSSQAEYCASEPPPEGLKKRCHSKSITVPENYKRFEKKINMWMKSCLSSKRVSKLVDENPSLNEVWGWVSSHKGRKFKIIPNYKPLSWINRRGKSCYGVESISFDVERKKGIVAGMDDGFTVTKDKTNDLQAAILKSINALETTDLTRKPVKRMRCVLEMLKNRKSSTDDTYFNLQPGIDLTDNLNPNACYKIGKYGSGKPAYDYHCREGADALRSCSNSFKKYLKNMVKYRNNNEIVESLLNKESVINGGLNWYRTVMNSTNGVMLCKQTKTHLLPALRKRLNSKKSIYSCYD